MASRSKNTLADIVLSGATAFPDRTAINTPNGALTHLQFKTVAMSFALRLKECGVDRSSCIALDLHHPIPVTAAAVAAALLGCSWVPASRTALDSSKALGISHLLHDGHGIDEHIRTLDAVRHLKRIKVDPSWMSPPKTNRATRRVLFNGYASPHNTWMIAQSSGTTGAPKFMSISGATAIQRLEYPFAEKEGVLSACCLIYPMSYLAIFTALRVLSRHGTFVSGPLEFLAVSAVDAVIGAPNQLLNFCATEGIARRKIPWGFTTGGAINRTFLTKIFDRFENVRNVYGSTEVGLVSSKIVGPSSIDDGSIGVPVNSCRVEIFDESGAPLPAGSEGEMAIQAPGMAKKYIGAPEESERVFRDGWFHPGDRGAKSSAGEVFIRGRVDDVLNVGGHKVNAGLVDQVVQGIDGIKDGLCFAEVAGDGRTRLAAIVAVAAGRDVDDVIEAIRANVAAKAGQSSVPLVVYVSDKVPRNENGKALRRMASAAVVDLAPIVIERR